MYGIAALLSVIMVIIVSNPILEVVCLGLFLYYLGKIGRREVKKHGAPQSQRLHQNGKVAP